MSTRTPYLPFVVLVGGALVVAMTISVLNGPNEPTHPLSGSPVGNDDRLPVPPARGASASLSVVSAVGTEGTDLAVGPGAFPPRGRIILSAVLPIGSETVVTVRRSRMARAGALAGGPPIELTVTPDVNGHAMAETSVEELTDGLGAGLYRLQVVWDDRVIGEADVAVGLFQPTSVAIFDEPRTVSFEAGRHTGVIFNRRGRIRDRKAARLDEPATATAIAHGRFNGASHVLVGDGRWAGHWLRLSDRVTL